MEDNNKLNRRSRPRPRSLPRPYDLRRKVLLKNFLREQMTYIPQIRMTSSAKNSDADFSVEQSNSVELDDLQGLNDENSSSSLSGVGNSSSSENIQEIDSIADINDGGSVVNSVSEEAAVNIKATDVLAPEPKFFRFASLMNLRSDSKKKNIKGIVKAKKVCKSVKSPVKSKSFKTGLERLLSGRSRTSNERSSDQTSKTSLRSLFSSFKSRRERRKVKQVAIIKPTSIDTKNTNKNDKNYTSNQSVQTDDSWAREELIKVEQSNRLLREENRLLSESLSYFMSSSSLDSQLNNHCGSPLQSSNRNMNGLKKFPGSYDNLSTNAPYDNGNPRSRILRSKSVQEHSERRNISRNNYRTRSMNYHNHRTDLRFGPTTSVSPIVQSQPYIIPRVRRKNVLASLPVNGTGRVVQRRYSMPERVLSENDRSRICRRSGSVRDTSRTPFHSLPAEAFY